MRKTLVALRAALALLFCVGAGSVSVSSAAGQSLEAIRQAGRLRVTVHRDDKPWSWQVNGKRTGIDVDIGAALANRLGVGVEYLDLRADADLNDDLGHGVWLGAFPGDVMLHVPCDRRIEASNDQIKLVAPYHTDSLAMAVDPAKAERAGDFSLFLTEKVAVEVGGMPDVILLSARDHALIDRVVHVRGVAQAATAYDRGEVSAFYGEAAIVENLAHTVSRHASIVHPQYALARDWVLCSAVGADAHELAAAIERAVAELRKSGEMQRIFAAYGVAWRAPSPD